MPMTAAGLSAAIKANLSARSWIRGSSTELQQLCDDIAGAVVTYITINATVVPTAMVVGSSPVTGVGNVT